MKALRVAAVSTKNWIDQADRSIKNMARWVRKAVKKDAELIVFAALGVTGISTRRTCGTLRKRFPALPRTS